ncbi:TldD/PmbA family protein [Myxococcota bacterium]|nr:TldD/PmbA family protein [Myxococcota bacterium]
MIDDLLTISEDPFLLDRRNFLKLSATAGTLGVLGTHCTRQAGSTTTPKTTAGHWTDAVSDALLVRIFDKAMSSGGSYCDLFFQRRRMLALGLEESTVNSAYSNVDLGAGIRVVHSGQTGYAYTESLDPESLLAAAEMAAAVAAGSPAHAKTPHRASKLPSYYPTGPVFSTVAPEPKVSLLMGLNTEIRRNAAVVKVAMSYYDEESSIFHVDSLGRSFRDEQPMTMLRVMATAERNGRLESNGYNCSGRAGFDFYTKERRERIVSETLRRTLVLFDAVPGPAGEYPLVLAPGSSGILLHEAIGHGMEADFAKSKTTIYTDKIGQRIAPEFVTIVDDGTMPGLRGSIHADDEGEKSQRTVLVENGIFRTFLHDRISAEHFALSPTGNGRRESFRHMPIPRMRNTYMLAGPHKPSDIIASVKTGVYAETFTNGQVAIGAGDFTFYIKNGYLIEDGKISTPIKDINIIGNGPRVLENVTMVGTDFTMDEGAWTCGKRGQGVPVGLGMPTCAVSSITIGGSRR